MAKPLGARKRSRFGLRHAFKEIEAPIVFGRMLLAEMVLPLAAGLWRRVSAFKVAVLVIAHTSLLCTRSGRLILGRLNPHIFELYAVGKWIAI
ncbi:hypothetical protein [Hyphomonas pacifica]|uniref:hypothetical protein n=1 Tax=Hyphomonas pacifica TaxID=1280941 RepID=UPI001F4261E3|nr:hypothetical protein [Hyphomonas pacifica]